MKSALIAVTPHSRSKRQSAQDAADATFGRFEYSRFLRVCGPSKTSLKKSKPRSWRA
jgi:hypothetical protein